MPTISIWTEASLLELITDQVAESLTLDYKASASLQRTDGKKAELCKDVSALANSAGGILIFGIQEDGHVPTALDNGSDPAEISKEWIEHVINSRIARRIDGVIIHQIWLSGPRAGRVAYVLDVPASARAPHMASDHRFYKRFNFESVPMEEYEVRDVSRRLAAPKLTLALTALNHQKPENLPLVPLLALHVENHGSAPAHFALITFHLSSKNFPSVGGIDKSAEATILSSGREVEVHSFKLEWRGSSRLPLMQGARYHVAQFHLSLAAQLGPASVFWEVFAPEADPSRGLIELVRVNGRLQQQDEGNDWKLSVPIRWQV